jgi:GntR family transcriptional regulator
MGEQLPSVREADAATAINPNKVLKAYQDLKAYRDLERDGLAEPRTGFGTFVRALPPGPPPDTHSRLGRKLATWVGEARTAGLDDESIESLPRVALEPGDVEDIA